MNASPKVSSLYGPGAFVGWICSMVSVLLSWMFNRQANAKDTMGNDLVAAVIVPSIAATQYHYTMWVARKKGEEPSMDVLDATSCIVAWYSVIGPWLFYLAAVKGRLKRLISTGLVSVLCLSVFVAITLHDNLCTKLPATRYFMIALLVCCLTGFGAQILAVVYLTRGKTVQHWRCPGNKLRAFSLVCLMIWWLTAATICWIFASKPAQLDNSTPRLSMLEALAVPRTGYYLRELDQAVALSAGILIVLCTIYEAIVSRPLAPWENYQKWRTSCEALLEEGLLEAEETARWKNELQLMAQQEKAMTDAPGETDILARLEKRRKERRIEVKAEKKARLEGMDRGEMVVTQLRNVGLI